MQKIRRITSLRIRKSTIFVINSSLGKTDCSGCLIYQKGPTLFAKHAEQPEFLSLPIKIAEMMDGAAVEEALRRIRYAIKTQKFYVDLTDLEQDETSPHL